LLLNNKYRLQYDPTKSEDYINPKLTGEDDDTDTPDTEDGL
jgi:hypothetical protein